MFGQPINGHRNDGPFQQVPFNQLRGLRAQIIYFSLLRMTQFFIVFVSWKNSSIEVRILELIEKTIFIIYISFFLIVAAAPKQSFPIADFRTIQTGQRVVGGLPKSIVWDGSGRYVAVMFKSSPSIAVFSTSINRDVLNISPNFNISGDDIDEYPSFICFRELYDKYDDVVLTIGWSTGRVQYFPLQ